MINYNSESGFIALISSVIIAVLLLTLTLSISTTGFFGRFNVLDSESKERSADLADACAESAILKISQNPSYNPTPAFNFSTQTGGESVSVNSDSCTIASTNISGTQEIIKTQAVFNKAVTNFRYIINLSDFSVYSIEECTNLTISSVSC